MTDNRTRSSVKSGLLRLQDLVTYYGRPAYTEHKVSNKRKKTSLKTNECCKS